MRDQLTQYVNLLFAGNSDAEDIRMEILQNTLDRYDDLISQGKTPEAAYRLAISGIGDIGELLDGQAAPVYSQANYQHSPVYTEDTTLEKLGLDLSRTMRAIAVGLYILSPIPVIGLDMIGMDVLGVCLTLAIVAAATVLMVLFRRKHEEPVDYARREVSSDHRKNLKKSINSLISTIGLVLYFIVSFATGAWYITWLIFPIIGAVNGLVNACLDLKEEM